MSNNLPKKRQSAKQKKKTIMKKGNAGGRTANLLTNYEPKKNQPASKKELKPIETIGNEKFKNLMSVFDRSKKTDNPIESGLTQVKKLEYNRCSTFNKQETDSLSQENKVLEKPVGISNGIKERMQKFLENNKNDGKTSSQPVFDPILKQRYNNPQEEDGEDGEEEYEDEDNYLGLSDEENEDDEDDQKVEEHKENTLTDEDHKDNNEDNEQEQEQKIKKDNMTENVDDNSEDNKEEEILA